VAAAVVLVTGAALLGRTLAALGAVDPGFRAERLVTAQVTYPATYDRDALGAGYEAIGEAVRAVPGVTGVALAGTIPFGPTRDAYATFIEDVTTNPNELPVIDVDRVGPGYFDVMGIPLLEGRGFDEADHAGAPPVAVVDERMARTYWPDLPHSSTGVRGAIGRRIRYPWAGAPWIEVVGVVGSVADDDLTAALRPRWYVPLTQAPTPNITIVLASALPGATVVADVRRAVASVDGRVPMSRVRPYPELLGDAAARTRLTARVLLSFALATLLLGCLGVYGMAAHMVRERRREIGVRMALGADAGRIGAAVLGGALGVVAPGALAGVVLAGASTRALRGMLFGVAPLDPATFALVPLVMLGAATLSVWLPARRAAAVDPLESLRDG